MVVGKLGQKSIFGIALVLVFFVLLITIFGLIEPFKNTLDGVRNQSSLNCPGTPGFDQTDYNDDTDFERLVKRPTCLATGMILVYFVGAFLIAGITWVVLNWRKSVK